MHTATQDSTYGLKKFDKRWYKLHGIAMDIHIIEEGYANIFEEAYFHIS